MRPLRSRRSRMLRDHNIACWCSLCADQATGKPIDIACAACVPCPVDVLGELLCEAVDA